MLINEGLDELGDFVLLAARKFGGSFKDLLQSSLGGLAFGFERFDAQELIDADRESLCQCWQDFAARGRAFKFPKGDVGMRNAQLLGQLCLGEAGGQPQLNQTLGQWGPVNLFVGLAHALSINRGWWNGG
jgi:hypothetical protein